MKKFNRQNEVSRVVNDILAYLADHPDACDTVEGIMQWWLLEQTILHRIKIVEEALAELCKKEFIIQNRSRNGRIRYRINQHKQQQIREFLNRVEHEQD